ncbi:cystatin-11 [Sciurus carolinensis]|uniref:cystatin-11 n=1 Tax=Sciurus carolinensis TaxID=30640 RepID=UPI001FB27E43|nr:cystatin-11 [Sciurus carolinensis]
MARLWQSLKLLLAILVALVASSYQLKKTFISIHEVSAVEQYVKDTLQYLTNEYNKESDDKYNFRILRILKIQKQVTDHMELHVNVEMQRTVCQKAEKAETSDCEIQQGELYKKIQCYFSAFVIPWTETYKLLRKNCSNS